MTSDAEVAAAIRRAEEFVMQHDICYGRHPSAMEALQCPPCKRVARLGPVAAKLAKVLAGIQRSAEITAKVLGANDQPGPANVHMGYAIEARNALTEFVKTAGDD